MAQLCPTRLEQHLTTNKNCCYDTYKNQIYIIENKIFYSNTIFSQLTNKPIIKIGENV